MTDRVNFLFFFSESLNYVELKLTFGMTFFFFFAGDKKDMIFKELKFYLLIKIEHTKTICFYAYSTIYGES